MWRQNKIEVMQVADVKVKGTPIGLYETDIHGDNERVVDAIEDALRFNNDEETRRSSKKIWLGFYLTNIVEEHCPEEPIVTLTGI
jgi:hypothetical protein